MHLSSIVVTALTLLYEEIVNLHVYNNFEHKGKANILLKSMKLM